MISDKGGGELPRLLLDKYCLFVLIFRKQRTRCSQLVSF